MIEGILIFVICLLAGMIFIPDQEEWDWINNNQKKDEENETTHIDRHG